MVRGNTYPLSAFLLLLIILALSQSHTAAEARPLQIHNAQGYSRIFATLGVACKCCDGVESGGGVCSSTWDSSCVKLQCLPWKSSP